MIRRRGLTLLALAACVACLTWSFAVGFAAAPQRPRPPPLAVSSVVAGAAAGTAAGTAAPVAVAASLAVTAAAAVTIAALRGGRGRAQARTCGGISPVPRYLFGGESKEVPDGTIYDFTVQNIDGADVKLSEYDGKVVLIVNVASK
mmetsp:Transcript_48305/g.103578  ORF Transcript_48305/g.103578 Transcript_48305/m.103578 type:complete len:146 (-) Transcript_48305:576-1013(-)